MKYMYIQIHFSRKHRFQEIVILKQQIVKSPTDASIWVMFISKNSNMLEIKHSLFHSHIIINRFGFCFRSTDLIPSIPGQFVNKLFCDRALLIFV